MHLSYRLSFPAPETHYVEVRLLLRDDAPLRPIVLYMPVWTPGSYLVREYARHVEGFEAAAPGTVTKIRKNAWRLDPGGGTTAEIRYRVYANELSVRTNHVDGTHAFLNGAATFVIPEGAEGEPLQVEVIPPLGWHVTTSLPGLPQSKEGEVVLVAKDFDTLVDSPLEIGSQRLLPFEVLGKRHAYAVWPADAISTEDAERLVSDTRTILETEAAFFGGVLPYDSYRFILHLSYRGRGGLEHKASTALLAPPTSFSTREAYLDLLSLVAHEAFHLWNVKRIRPEGLTPYRYQEENYTRLLFWFEGATSYYEWRILRRAGLATEEEYLDHLAGEFAYLEQTRGRLVHPLTETSFDAWIKAYRPDENSHNSTVSYYRKGEITLFLLDLEIRARSGDRKSLDDVLLALWQRYGLRERPVPENGLFSLIEEVAETSLADLFEAWFTTAREMDYEKSLAKGGFTLESSRKPNTPGTSLGIRVRDERGRVVIAGVERGGAAHKAGLDPNDELLAIAGRRVEGLSLDSHLLRRAAGDTVEVLVTRDGRILSRSVILDAARPDRLKLSPMPQMQDAVKRRHMQFMEGR